MLTLPAGWPDPADLVQTPPVVYLHILDSSWPPASSDGDYPLDAGWVEVGSWSTDSDLVGSLLPGQINAPWGFTASTAKAAFRHALSLAPWKTAAQRVRVDLQCELVASYDGPSGATAFRLGLFNLDPITGKASDRVLSLDMIDGWVGMDRPHEIYNPSETGDDPTDRPFDVSEIIRQIVRNTPGPDTSANVPDLGTTLTSIYFAGADTWRKCLQDLLGANLAAARRGPDGGIEVLAYEDLSGVGEVVDTLNVLDQFEDLEWVIDPAEKFDRVEVKFAIPEYALDSETVTKAEQRDISIWVSPTKYRLLAGASVDYMVDPGAAVGISDETSEIFGNTAKDGSGTSRALLLGEDPAIPLSTGRIPFTVKNAGTGVIYRVDSDGEPSFLRTTWKDISGSDTSHVAEWGASANEATNPLSIDLGKLIQSQADAEMIRDRIVARVRAAATRIATVSVVPDLRRQIGDLVWLQFPEDGLSTKAIITSVHSEGSPGSLVQTLDLVLLAPLVSQFNAAIAGAHPGWTIADFNAAFAGSTIADFNESALDV